MQEAQELYDIKDDYIKELKKYKGKEITSDTARVNELEQAISVKMGEVKGYEAHIIASITETCADAIEYDYDSELLYKVDKNGNLFFIASLEYNQQNSEIISYAVDTENHGKVVYTETTNLTTKQTFTDVYSVDEGEGSSSGYIIPTILALPIEVLKTVLDPMTYAETFNNNPQFSANYYSRGDGNLTIEASETEYGGDHFGKRYLRMTYENYLLSYAKIESKYSVGANNRKERYEINNFTEMSDLSITLPDGWEEHMSQAGQ